MTKNTYFSPYESSGSVFFSPKERENQIVKYAYLVKQIAHRISMRLPSSVRQDELISAGCLGLIDAVDKFNPNKDVSLKTYAQYRIRGAILDELRSMDWYSRSMRKRIHDIEKAIFAFESRETRPAEDEDIAAELGVSINEYHEMLFEIHGASILSLDTFLKNEENTESKKTFQDNLQGDDDPSENIGREELKKGVAKAISMLSKKEQIVVSLYYYDELTLKEIGKVMDLTESRICQIHSGALIKLRTRLAGFK